MGTGVLGYYTGDKRLQKRRLKFERSTLKIPILKRYIIQSALARFARTLATLIDGGLPLTNSLAFAKESLYNARLAEILETVANRVVEGKTISEELSQYKEIPPLFSRMIKSAENSGKILPCSTSCFDL